MPRSGLVLHPDIMGVRPLFDDLCRRLATHGLAVYAPEPFARLPDREGLDPAARMEHVRELDDALQLGDLERAADWLVVHDDVTEVAVLGFCMGGMYALKAAATGRFDRAVAFYGMIRVPESWRGPRLREPLDTAADVCPTLAIFGSADPYTPAPDIDALRAAWKDRGDCEIVVYDDAEHGFVHDAERPAHRADDAADAWARVLRFLGVDDPGRSRPV
jgi:carboxymethylenebutenolidase